MLKKSLLVIIILSFMLAITGCQDVGTPSAIGTDKSQVYTNSDNPENTGAITTNEESTTSQPEEQTPADESTQGTNAKDNEPTAGQRLTIHFIDVGQADSILIQQGTGSMLIDAGNNGDANTVVNYLKEQGVKKLDDLILTHPHEDHIGGADAVIKAFNISKVYMPKVTTTTKTFEDVVTTMRSKGLNAAAPVPGTEFNLGKAVCTVLAPTNTSYTDLNNYSIVIRLTFGKNSFLFTGDAENLSEGEILKNGYELKSDVLKLGHHGSDGATSDAFLKAVAPKYAVISVGKDNDYNHPHKATMDKLQAAGIVVYRTDENGTIICTSDGNNVTFNTKPGDYRFGDAAASENKGPSPVLVPAQTNSESKDDRIVYYTDGGKSYHYSKSCPTLSRSKNIREGKLQDVINLGKADPCDKCVK